MSVSFRLLAAAALPVGLVILVHGLCLAADPVPSEPSAFRRDAYAAPWAVTTFAGVLQDPATLDAGGQPIAHDENGFPLYAADGDEGPAAAARIGWPRGLAAGPDGSLYYCEWQLCVVRRITPDGIIHRFAGHYGEAADYTHPETVGDGGAALEARLNHPVSVAVDREGAVYVADFGRIRRIAADGTISTIAGSAPVAANYEPTHESMQRALDEFSFVGPATEAVLAGGLVLRSIAIDEIAIGLDGTVYALSRQLGIRTIKDGVIRPLLPAGGAWFNSLKPEWVFGQYSFSHIALDSHGRLYAAGGAAGTSAMLEYPSASSVLRITADGTVATFAGGADRDSGSRAWDSLESFGPVREGVNPLFGELAFDAADHLWFNGTNDGARMWAHYDDDRVIRYSGYTWFHSPWPGWATFVEDSPSTLTPGLDDFPKSLCRMPDGSWTYLQFRSGNNVEFGASARILRMEDRAPVHQPRLVTTTPLIEATTSAGADGFNVEIDLRNDGDMYAHVPIADSDQAWVFPEMYLHSQIDGLIPAGGEMSFQCYVMPSMLYQAGVHTANISIMIPGTRERVVVPLRITVTTAHPPANMAPTIVGQRSDPYIVHEDEQLRIDLATQVADDGLPLKHGLSFRILQSPTYGTTTLDGSILTYTPPADFNHTHLDFDQTLQHLIWEVSDGELSTWQHRLIYVLSVNDAPTVSAGADQANAVGALAALSGSAGDIDWTCEQNIYIRPQPVQLRWRAVSGPGVVTFADDRSASTTATFTAPGAYTLRLTADDSLSAVSDDVVVTVEDAGGTGGTGSTGSAVGKGTTGGATTGPGIGGGGGGCGHGSGIVALAVGMMAALSLCRRQSR